MKKYRSAQLSASRGGVFFGTSLAITLALVFFSAPAQAAEDASDLAITAKLGANWSILSQPDDAVGEPTLLSGSAFDGVGFSGGVAGIYQLAELQGARFEFEGGLFYNYHSGDGYEGIESTGEKRTITLSAHAVQIPLLLHLKSGMRDGGFRIGAGLVPMLGLQSGATVELENSDQSPKPLETTPTIHLGLSAVLGYDFAIDPTYSIPLEIRLNWDPMVKDTTRERFADYQSLTDTGAYQVAHNWQFFFMTGIRYDL